MPPTDHRVAPLSAARSFPAVVSPTRATAPAAWALEHREEMNRLLREHGALLFRGFDLKSAEDFHAFSAALSESPWTGNPNVYTIRNRVGEGVYTSTEYPESQTLTQHCEFSHSPFKKWPMKLFFFCQQAATEGGATPIADSRRVFARIPPALREQFLEKQLRYTRIFYEGEVSWQQVFQTEDPQVVERFVKEQQLEHEWRNGHRDLRLEWKLHVAARHPETHELLWFNQAHTVAFAAISPEMREYFLGKHGYANRPVDCAFANGTPIPPEALRHLQGIYEEESVDFPWHNGDVMLLDNMLMSHGRRPFKGPRRVLVAMANEVKASAVETL